MLKCEDTDWNAKRRRPVANKIDGKVRKLRYIMRFDTSLFLTVNDANKVLVI